MTPTCSCSPVSTSYVSSVYPPDPASSVMAFPPVRSTGEPTRSGLQPGRHGEGDVVVPPGRGDLDGHGHAGAGIRPDGDAHGGPAGQAPGQGEDEVLADDRAVEGRHLPHHRPDH